MEKLENILERVKESTKTLAAMSSIEKNIVLKNWVTLKEML